LRILAISFLTKILIWSFLPGSAGKAYCTRASYFRQNEKPGNAAGIPGIFLELKPGTLYTSTVSRLPAHGILPGSAGSAYCTMVSGFRKHVNLEFRLEFPGNRWLE
jgi:hypothetical protein